MYCHSHTLEINKFSIQLIPSFLSLNNMVPLPYKDGIRIFKSLDKSIWNETTLSNIKSPGKMNVDTFQYRDISTFAKARVKWMWIPSFIEIHICKSLGKMNVDTFLYRVVSTFAKVRAKWMWIPSFIEMYPRLQSQGKMTVDTFLYREEYTWIKVRFGVYGTLTDICLTCFKIQYRISTVLSKPENLRLISGILRKLTNVQTVFRAWTKSLKRTNIYFVDWNDFYTNMMVINLPTLPLCTGLKSWNGFISVPDHCLSFYLVSPL